MTHIKQWIGGISGLVLCLPMLALGQIQIQLPPPPPGTPLPEPVRPAPQETYREEPRGLLQVTNDWEEAVQVTVWSQQRERIGNWRIDRGRTVTFAEDGHRIRVRPHYKIKVGEDWGWVDVGQVGEFQRGTWHVRVRDIWRATHGGRQRERTETPDWRR